MEKSLEEFFKPYQIRKKRETTINAAFAYAIAAVDDFDSSKFVEAIRILGQEQETSLKCVYCNKDAESWDHIIGVVDDKEYSGFGHTFANLVPCCNSCNSRKQNRDWQVFVREVASDPKTADQISERIRHLQKTFSTSGYTIQDVARQCPDEIEVYKKLRSEILSKLQEADDVAETIRKKMRT